MTPKEFRDLKYGDIVRNLKTGYHYIVVEQTPGYYVVIHSVFMDDPENWELTHTSKEVSNADAR